jgi:hypothetical protein
MSALVGYDVVTKMLEDCAKGHNIFLADHFRRVLFNKKTYPSLPKAKEIEIGHIRSMVRHLEINQECATKHIPGLFKINKAEKEQAKEKPLTPQSTNPLFQGPDKNRK